MLLIRSMSNDHHVYKDEVASTICLHIFPARLKGKAQIIDGLGWHISANDLFNMNNKTFTLPCNWETT